MPGGGRIEQDVVEFGSRAGIAQEPRELIEGRDFDGAGAGKLFFHARDGCVWKYASVRPHKALPILAGNRLGINIQGPQAGDFGHGRRLAAQRNPQHLIQVRRRIGANQQDSFPAICQLHGRSAGERGLSDASFARKEQVSCGLLDELHENIPLPALAGHFVVQIASTLGSRLPTIALTASRPGCRWNGQSDPLGQLHARRIYALADRHVIDAEQRQALDAHLRQGLPNRRVVAEGGWLLGQAKSLDLNPQASEPFEISGQARQAGLTLGPQTPVEQHIGGSNTSILTMKPTSLAKMPNTIPEKSGLRRYCFYLHPQTLQPAAWQSTTDSTQRKKSMMQGTFSR